MGNASSRRVTIVNDDTVGVVQISDSVVKRLRTNPDKEPEKPKLEKTEVKSPKRIVHQPVVQNVVPTPPPETPYFSSLEQRQKFHEEFKHAKESWQRTIDDLEQKNEELFNLSQNKLLAEMVRVEETYLKQTFEPVCPDKQEKVQKCYQENLKRPLMCSREVKDFTKCLEESRKTILSS